MNPYLILGLAATWALSLAGAFHLGSSYEKGQQAEQTVLVDKVTEKVTAANQQFTDDLGLQIAVGFQGIRVTNTTINQEVRHEHEIQTKILDNPDCNIPVTTWRLLQRSRGFDGTDGPSPSGVAPTLPTGGQPPIPAPGR